MTIPKKTKSKGMTRRDALKVSGLGLAASGVAVAGGGVGKAIATKSAQSSNSPKGDGLTDKNTYFTSLQPYFPGKETLDSNEMRITFMGSWYNPRMAQACNSVFVEVGDAMGAPDQFVFDCGPGIVSRYFAMGVPLSRMDKVFLTHIHADHMSDLTWIYCFGPSADRKWPLYVWGPGRSRFTWTDPDGNNVGPYNDGTSDYCSLLRQAARWHTESFSFQTTSRIDPPYTVPTYADWGIQLPSPVGGGSYPSNPAPVPGDVPSDAPTDAYAWYAIDLSLYADEETLEYKEFNGDDNIAYNNPKTGVKITYFPAIHTRRGSISYKLEWNGLSMIFTGDTKPNYDLVQQAASGVDVLIHEIASPPEVWVEKFTGLTPADEPAYSMALLDLTAVQNSSHTPQKMFGYLLKLIKDEGVPPRLAVGTHFAATDDVIAPALSDIRVYYPQGEITVATDLMVINVTKAAIGQRRAVVSDYVWAPPGAPGTADAAYEPPKYWKYVYINGKKTDKKVGDPYAQIDDSNAIPRPPDYNG